MRPVRWRERPNWSVSGWKVWPTQRWIRPEGRRIDCNSNPIRSDDWETELRAGNVTCWCRWWPSTVTCLCRWRSSRANLGRPDCWWPNSWDWATVAPTWTPSKNPNREPTARPWSRSERTGPQRWVRHWTWTGSSCSRRWKRRRWRQWTSAADWRTWPQSGGRVCRTVNRRAAMRNCLPSTGARSWPQWSDWTRTALGLLSRSGSWSWLHRLLRRIGTANSQNHNLWQSVQRSKLAEFGWPRSPGPLRPTPKWSTSIKKRSASHVLSLNQISSDLPTN